MNSYWLTQRETLRCLERKISRVDTLQISWEHNLSGFVSLCHSREGFNMSTVVQPDQPLEALIQCLSELINDVEAWARELGWSTRRVERLLSDSDVENVQVSSLLLAKGEWEIWINPMYRSALDLAGVVEIYLMPIMEDVVTLLLTHGIWKCHVRHQACMKFDSLVVTGETLSRETLRKILDVVMRHEV